MPARVFVAIELPPATRDLMYRAAEAMCAVDPSWLHEKLVRAELMHVTVAFIGAVPDPALPVLLERLRPAAGRTRPFGLRLAGARAVPSPARASMVWATCDGDPGVAAALSATIAEAAGLTGEGRHFAAHATLARARRPRRVEAAALQAASSVLSDAGKEADRAVSVLSVTVFSSTLSSGGPTYERLAILPLGTMDGGAAPVDIEQVFV